MLCIIIKAVRQKRRLLQAEIQDLTQEADKLAIKAEKKSDLTYLSQSNNKKRLCKQKQKEVNELNEMEEQLLKK